MPIKSISPQRKILIILLCVISTILFTTKEGTAQNNINVLYVSENVEDWRDDSFLTAMDLDPVFEIQHSAPNSVNFSSYSTGTALLAEYDLVCLLDIVLTSANQTLLKDYVSVGGSLLILCGNNLTTSSDLFVT